MKLLKNFRCIDIRMYLLRDGLREREREKRNEKLNNKCFENDLRVIFM